jgi:hypothetical protein
MDQNPFTPLNRVPSGNSPTVAEKPHIGRLQATDFLPAADVALSLQQAGGVLIFDAFLSSRYADLCNAGISDHR